MPVLRVVYRSEGGWDTKAFRIVGQEATCGNTSVIDHNSNPSAVILPNGVVVLAYVTLVMYIHVHSCALDISFWLNAKPYFFAAVVRMTCGPRL